MPRFFKAIILIISLFCINSKLLALDYLKNGKQNTTSKSKSKVKAVVEVKKESKENSLVVVDNKQKVAKALSLEDCIDYAVKNSPELKKTSLNYANQLLKIVIENAQFDFGINGSLNRRFDSDINTSNLALTKQLPDGTNVTISGTTVDKDPLNDVGSDTATGSIRVSKTILGGGSWAEVQRGIDTSLIDETIKLNDLEKQRRHLIFTIKEQYYRVLQSVKTIPLQENRLRRSKRNLEHAIEREEPLDIANARVQVPQDELSLIKSQSAAQKAVDELKRRMGVPVGHKIKINTELDFKNTEISFEDDLINALSNHEDILNSRLTLKKLDIDYKVSDTKIMPEVNIDGSYSKSSEEGINLSGLSDKRIGLSFNWDIGSNAQKASRDRQKNALRNQNLEIFIIQQRVEQTLRGLERDVKVAKQGIDLKKQALDVAKLRLELFKDRWDNGEIGILEYVRAQNDLENAKVSLLNEKADFLSLIARYRYEAAIK